MTANLLTLNCSKTEFHLIRLKQQLSKLHDSSLTTTHSARNLGFIFDEHLTFSDQISAFSKSCYDHIRELRCIRPYLDFKTASTIATSIVHSKLDYCNSLYHNLLNYQLPVGISPPRLVWKTRIVWLSDSDKISKIRFIHFDMIHERDRQTDRQTNGQTDRRTDRHRMTAIAALMHRIARQKLTAASNADGVR